MNENTLEDNLLGNDTDRNELQGDQGDEGDAPRLNPGDVRGIRIRHSSSFEMFCDIGALVCMLPPLFALPGGVAAEDSTGDKVFTVIVALLTLGLIVGYVLWSASKYDIVVGPTTVTFWRHRFFGLWKGRPVFIERSSLTQLMFDTEVQCFGCRGAPGLYAIKGGAVYGTKQLDIAFEIPLRWDSAFRRFFYTRLMSSHRNTYMHLTAAMGFKLVEAYNFEVTPAETRILFGGTYADHAMVSMNNAQSQMSAAIRTYTSMAAFERSLLPAGEYLLLRCHDAKARAFYVVEK
jgi:hypothetical protein